MCYTQICPRFECRDEHTIHTCVYCVLTLNAGPGIGVCVWGGVEYVQRVKSSLSSRPITGSFWAGLATFLVTCPVDRLN